jgi:hypothetical protein
MEKLFNVGKAFHRIKIKLLKYKPDAVINDVRIMAMLPMFMICLSTAYSMNLADRMFLSDVAEFTLKSLRIYRIHFALQT